MLDYLKSRLWLVHTRFQDGLTHRVLCRRWEIIRVYHLSGFLVICFLWRQC